ncbi:MAG: hypothetical protein U5Q16_10815 [Gammaproteobacteria bacterium]|nr:hypothetical protein [Gammaproteobacteria bacterium]
MKHDAVCSGWISGIGEQEGASASGWHEHEDINDVMLVTSLAPEMFLTI